MKTVLSALLLSAAALAESPLLRADVEAYLAEAEREAEAEEVLVTATAAARPNFDTPYASESVSRRAFERKSFRTLPQALREVPGVMVQETAPGQGSPYIRGLTGFHNLLLIDGIRLNNSVFRPGPNQYWSTVDTHSIQRLEVVKGPASVLYGSDAIGGAVQAITKDPYAVAGAGAWGAGGLVHGRYASAENSWVGRGEASVARGEAWALLFGFTGKHFGDVVAGSPMGRVDNTSHDEVAGDVKVERWIDPDTRLVLAYQHVRQNNVPRTHSTVFSESFHGTAVGSDLRRDSDQERWLVYAQLHKENMDGPVEVLRMSLSWHAQSEVEDRVRGSGSRTLQGFDVGTLGWWTRVEVPSAYGRFTFGVEVYHDNVSSFSSSNPVQGPVADDATYELLGAFLQDEVAVGERWTFLFGARVTYAAADADSVSDPDTGGRISISDNWVAVVGSARALYELEPERWNLFGGVSQGFRAPNLSDLTRFDSARSNEFEIPSPGLDPERTVTFEIGAKGRPGIVRTELTLFYTIVRDLIERFPTGNTNGSGEFEVAKDNVGDGYIWGVELAGSVRVHPAVTVFGTATFLEGRTDTFTSASDPKSRQYITRLMPLTVLVGVRVEPEESRWWVEGVVQRADRADRPPPSDQADTQRIPPGGTPGYGVVHLRGGYDLDGKTRLMLALENLFDKSYRIHGSGTNMPGFNVVASVTKDF